MIPGLIEVIGLTMAGGAGLGLLLGWAYINLKGPYAFGGILAALGLSIYIGGRIFTSMQPNEEKEQGE